MKLNDFLKDNVIIGYTISEETLGQLSKVTLFSPKLLETKPYLIGDAIIVKGVSELEQHEEFVNCKFPSNTNQTNFELQVFKQMLDEIGIPDFSQSLDDTLTYEDRINFIPNNYTLIEYTMD